MNQDVWMCRCGWGHGRSAAFCSKCRDPSPWLRAKGAKRQPAVEDLQAEIAALKAQLAQAREETIAACVETAEALLHPEPIGAASEIDRVVAYSNGTVRRIVAALRAIASQPENPEAKERE